MTIPENHLASQRPISLGQSQIQVVSVHPASFGSVPCRIMDHALTPSIRTIACCPQARLSKDCAVILRAFLNLYRESATGSAMAADLCASESVHSMSSDRPAAGMATRPGQWQLSNDTLRTTTNTLTRFPRLLRAQPNQLCMFRMVLKVSEY